MVLVLCVVTRCDFTETITVNETDPSIMSLITAVDKMSAAKKAFYYMEFGSIQLQPEQRFNLKTPVWVCRL